MTKIKNTNNYSETITCEGVEFSIAPNMVMEVNAVVLGSLPSGVVIYKETLTEIDPYTNKNVQEKQIDTSQLLTEMI